MTFVTLITEVREHSPLGTNERKPEEMLTSYSANCSSASRALKSQMVKLRPSILSIPSAWKRERLRETSSRTVPIYDASSWLLTGRVISTPSFVRLPSF
jgi:hypothetical protein